MESESQEQEEKPPVLKICVVVVLFVIAGWLASRQLAGVSQAAATDVWYYDLGANKLFSHTEKIPPIAAPSGSSEGAVLAMVYSCGECSDEKKRFVAWLVTTKPEGRSAMEQQVIPGNVSQGIGTRMEFLQGVSPNLWQIKLLEDTSWVDMDSKIADKLRAAALKDHCAKGAAAKPCAGPGSL